MPRNPDAADDAWAAAASRSSDGLAGFGIEAWTPAGFFDAAAGLPPSPACLEWLQAGLAGAWADPLGRHSWAARSSAVLAQSRARVAELLGCGPHEVWFAGGAEAALATAVRAVSTAAAPGACVLASPIERLAVLRTLDDLPVVVQLLPVDGTGTVGLDPPALSQAAQLAVVQAANREIGTRQPLAAIAAALPPKTVLLVDATAVRSPHDLPSDWDVIVLDPAMWGGPPGVSVVGCRAGVPWLPQPPASSTDRFPGCGPPALAAAAAMSLPDPLVWAAEEERIRALAAGFAQQLSREVGQVAVLGAVLGAVEHRLAHLVSLSMLYVSAEQLVDDLSRLGFAVHSGSACTSDLRRPSHVLTAIGALTGGNLRVSLPPGCHEGDVHRLAAAISDLVSAQRREAGLG